MMRTDFLLQFRHFAGVGGKATHHIHPVKRRELIKVHDMVMRVKRRIHQVADDVRVFRDLDPDCVFHATHGRQCVNAGANPANTLNEGPSVTRIATFQNDFEPTPHCAGALGVGNDIIVIDHGLHAQVSFDTRDRIHDDTTICHYSSLPSSLLVFFARACATADMAACAMAATPTTPTVAKPTLSAVASMPPNPGGMIVGS